MLISILGLVCFWGIVFCFSENRSKIRFLPLCAAFAVQCIVLWIVMSVPLVQSALLSLCNVFELLKDAAKVGTSCLFGYLGGGECPFDITNPGARYVLAFEGFPVMIVISALTMLLFHLGVLQFFIRQMSKFFRRVNVTGIVGFFSSLKIFMSYTDISVLMKNYVPQMSRGELLSVFSVGLSTTAAVIFCVLSTMAGDLFDNCIMQIFLVTLLNIMLAMLVSKVIIPEDVSEYQDVEVDCRFENSLDAISNGAQEGGTIVFRIVVVMIAIMGVIHIVNAFLGILPSFGGRALSLEYLLSFLFAPFVWLVGVVPQDVMSVSFVVAQKFILNEVVAMNTLNSMRADFVDVSSARLAFYMLCNFGNLLCVFLTATLYASFNPERKKLSMELAIKALFITLLVSFMSAAMMNIANHLL